MTDDGGIGRLERRFNGIPRAVKAAALPAVLKAAEDIAAAMRGR